MDKKIPQLLSSKDRKIIGKACQKKILRCNFSIPTIQGNKQRGKHLEDFCVPSLQGNKQRGNTWDTECSTLISQKLLTKTKNESIVESLASTLA